MTEIKFFLPAWVHSIVILSSGSVEIYPHSHLNVPAKLERPDLAQAVAALLPATYDEFVPEQEAADKARIIKEAEEGLVRAQNQLRWATNRKGKATL